MAIYSASYSSTTKVCKGAAERLCDAVQYGYEYPNLSLPLEEFYGNIRAMLLGVLAEQGIAYSGKIIWIDDLNVV